MTKITVAAAVAILSITAVPAFAQQGTTLAGPAQGSKANGSSSTMPSGESGAGGGAMTRGEESPTAGAAAGATSGRTTETGGNPGGAAGRN